jgi:hypothetical protein
MKIKYWDKRVLPILMVLGMLIPLLLLFKNYPEQIPCGKIVHLSNHLTVPVNCDSSIFLRDSDNPRRLFDGTSTYSDRPLPALVVLSLDKILSNVGVPERRVQIRGNSGVLYNYSQRKYALFVFLNFLVLLSALIFVLKTLKYNWDLKEVSNLSIMMASNAVLIITTNELIKTFIWTPHTQLFNILLPSFAFWEASRTRHQMTRFREIGSILFFISVAMFCYPIFCLAVIPILFMRFKSLLARTGLIGLSLLPYISYPYFVRFFGGTYTNQQANKFREFLWILDIITGKSSSGLFFTKITEFLKSFPVMPFIVTIIFVVIYKQFLAKWQSAERDIFKVQLIFIISYAFFLLGIGLGERRLTFGIILFSTLSIFWKVSRTTLKARAERYLCLVLSMLAVFQIICFITTLGPLK